MTFTDQVMLERFVVSEGTLALCALEVLGSVKRLMMFGTIAVIGSLLVTQTLVCGVEDSGADWACFVLVGVVAISGALVLKRRSGRADSALVSVCVSISKVNVCVGIQLLNVISFVFVTVESISARYDSPAAASEEMPD